MAPVDPIPSAVHRLRGPRIRGCRRSYAALILVLALAACTDSSPPSAVQTGPAAARTSPSTAAPPVDPTRDLAAAKITYRAFWKLLAAFDQRHPESQWRTVLGRVAVEPQLSQAIAVARQQRRVGVRLYGEPRPREPRVTISGNRASVSDCGDFSRYGQVDAKTGNPKTVGLARNPVKATLTRVREGVWRVVEVSYPGGTC